MAVLQPVQHLPPMCQLRGEGEHHLRLGCRKHMHVLSITDLSKNTNKSGIITIKFMVIASNLMWIWYNKIHDRNFYKRL